jgi:hypothetical protein
MARIACGIAVINCQDTIHDCRGIIELTINRKQHDDNTANK